jgi:hypothetical protein
MTLRILVLAVLLAAPLAHAEAVTLDCAIPADFNGPPGDLPRVSSALADGHFDILAIGTATMVGPEVAFPYRMLSALQDARPEARITLSVESQRGLTAADQLAMMRAALASRHYALVVWQTGTVEAVRNLSVTDFGETLSQGAGLARQAGADLLLVDAQFSRFLAAKANIEPYEAVLRQAATLPDVQLFRRYDLMRSWVAEGGIDLEQTTADNRLATTEKLHRCLGEALAGVVLSGASHVK